MGNELPLGLAALAGSAGALIGSRVAGRTARLVEELPTSSCAGVFLGLNEVTGTIDTQAPSSSPFAKVPAVYWSFTVEEEREHARTVTERDSQGQTRTRTETYTEWHTIDSGSHCHDAFDVVDESGRVQIRPSGAKITPRTTVSEINDERINVGWFRVNASGGGHGATGRIRRTEEVLAVGDVAFVVGTARLRDDVIAPELAAQQGEPFIVSLRAQEKIRKRSHIGAAVLAVLSAALLIAGSVGVLTSTGWAPWAAALPGVGVALLISAVIWTVGAYNWLVRLAHRNERAQSLLDVQLQRRAELVPQLVDVVQAAAAHEASLLERLAELRASGVADLRSGGAVIDVIARAEALPSLHTDGSFRLLADQLIDAENRIAAARGFIVDGSQVLATRADEFPVSLVSGRILAGRARR